MVAGIVNHKNINDVVYDIDFIAYEVINPILKPSEQITLLLKLDVNTVMYKMDKYISNEILSDVLVDWRNNYNYEIDGVLVTNDNKYERKIGNPTHAFVI
jgi:NAD-dependent DNA ligase